MTIAHEIGHCFTLCFCGFRLERNFSGGKIPAFRAPEWQTKGTNGKHGLPEEAHSSGAYIRLHPNGNTKQLRVYNKNLKAKTDIEYSVHQGKMTFHAHDYVNGIRQPARSLTSEEKKALWEIFWRKTMTKQEFNEL